MIHHREQIGIELSERSRPKGVIKRCNSDFIVREMTAQGVLPLLSCTQLSKSYGKGAYVLFNMTKQGLTSNDAVAEVAQQLHVPPKDITMQGMKDRWAITSQLIAIKSASIAKKRQFDHDRIYLRNVGMSSSPLRIGGNEGNRFWIRVRRCSAWPNLSNIHSIPNFFGSQRFGRYGSEHHIGRLLLTGNAEEAENWLTFPPLRKQFEQALQECDRDYKQAFLHPVMINASKFSLLQWQSYLFNRLLSLCIQSGSSVPDILPLWHSEHDSLYQKVWKHGDIDEKFEQLVVWTQRRTTVSPSYLTFRSESNQDFIFEFELPSGSYATIVLGQMFTIVETEHGG